MDVFEQFTSHPLTVRLGALSPLPPQVTRCNFIPMSSD